MTQLEAKIAAEKSDQLVPGEFRITVVFSNSSNTAATFNVAQAEVPSLVLQVEDAQGKTVPMSPPGAPREEQGARAKPIEPGESVTLEYVGFLDRSLAAGQYRVRYVGAHEPTGGTQEDPLTSEWLDFDVAEPSEKFDVAEPLPQARPEREAKGIMVVFYWFRNYWHRLMCLIRRIFGWERCDRVVTRDVDEARTEVMSNAPPGFEAWNGTYSWRARFRVVVDQPNCRVTVTIRVRLVGNITAAQRTAWENAIEAAWSNIFKSCCFCCCCSNGYTFVANIQFVNNNEHQVVNVGNSTTNMGNWGRNDTTAISHEFGHMLGALDEYYTVDGTAWGLPFQVGAGIMNNPNEGPLARHYALVEQAVEAALGTTCSTRPVAQNC